MWLHFNDGPNFIGRDIKTEPHIGFGSEPDAIAYLKSSQSNACGVPIFFNEDNAGRLKRMFRCNQLFGLAVVLARFEI
jgi:hypothetical protein